MASLTARPPAAINLSPKALSWALLAPAFGCILAFVVMPILSIGLYSFRTDSIGAAQFTLVYWQDFLTDSFYSLILFDTLRLAFITTVICVLLGYPPAYVLSQVGARWKGLLVVLLFLPSWISYVVRMMSWIHILGNNGLVNSFLLSAGFIESPLPLLYNDFSIYVGLVQYLLPLMILNIYIGLQSVDRNVVDAARTLGATEWQAFWAVTFPWSLPGMSVGCLLCFILAAGSYVTPLLLGGPGTTYYSSLIYQTVIPQLDWPLGATLSLVFILVLSLVLFAYGRLMGLSHVFKGARL